MYPPAPGFRPTNPRILAVLMIHPLCPVEWGSCLRNCPHAYLQPRKTLRVLRFLCFTLSITETSSYWEGFSRLFSLPVIEVLVAAKRSLCGICEPEKESGIDV